MLEGSVRRSHTRLRVSAQLINGVDGSHIFSKRYDRELIDTFALQDEISADIAEQLKVRRGLYKRSTQTLTAYQSFLEGRFHWHKYTPAGFARALQCYERAVALDPDYASAWTGIAEYHVGRVVDAGALGRECLPKAAAAARRALELDDTHAEAYAVLGQVAAMLDYDWATSKAHFERALETHASTHVRLAYAYWYLLPLGRSLEASAECDQVISDDPLLPVGYTAKATALLFAGAWEEAADSCLRALDIDPGFPKALHILSYIRGYQNRFSEALELARRLSGLLGKSCLDLYVWGMVHAARGDRAAAHAALREIESLPDGACASAANIAWIHALLIDKNPAFDSLKLAIEARDPRVLWIDVHPSMDAIRDDPRFISLANKMNLRARRT